MTHRIDVADLPSGLRVVFCGALDRAALTTLEAHVRALRVAPDAPPVNVVLAEGTEVDPECVAPLRVLAGAEVTAVSPFLRLWLAGPRGRP